MENKTVHKLPFLEIDRHTFDLIREGRKKIETRAGSLEYLQIHEGDEIEFSCGKQKSTKQVEEVIHYKDLKGLFSAFKPSEIHPEILSYTELRSQYERFPGYKERLAKYGVLVFKFKEI